MVQRRSLLLCRCFEHDVTQGLLFINFEHHYLCQKFFIALIMEAYVFWQFLPKIDENMIISKIDTKNCQNK